MAGVAVGGHERVDGERLSDHLGLGLEAELRAHAIVHRRLCRVIAGGLDRKGAAGKDILGRGRPRRRGDLPQLAVLLLLLLLLLLLREPLGGELDIVWVLAAWVDIVWLGGGAARRCC